MTESPEQRRARKRLANIDATNGLKRNAWWFLALVIYCLFALGCKTFAGWLS